MTDPAHPSLLPALRRMESAGEQICGAAADEIERLRSALRAIQQATIDGTVCDDVAWFSPIETLHDFCNATLHGSK